jgi:hypothetical protein
MRQAIGLVLVLFGVIVLVIGVLQGLKWMKYREGVPALTVGELAGGGAKGKTYITVTEYLFSPWYVYAAARSDKSRVTAAFIPMVSSQGRYARELESALTATQKSDTPVQWPQGPVAFEALMINRDVRSIGDIEQFYDVPALGTLEVVSTSELDGEEKASIAHKYPQVSLDGIVLLKYNPRLPSGGAVVMGLGQGVVMVVAGVWFYLWGLGKRRAGG